MKRHTLVLLIALLQGQLALAQRIEGVVQSQGEAIIGATVQLPDLEVGVITDQNGNFFLPDVEAGSHQLEIRSVGFKPFQMTVGVPLAKPIIIELDESTLSMEEVVVTGTLQPTFVSQSPIKVEVVTAKYLGTYSPSAATSVVEGISLVNGVQEVVACGVCFTNSISINGLPGPYTAVLMDGAPIYGNLASVYGLNGIPSMIIDRFEVIKGPSSTLYGSEAVAGVINIITKDPEDQPNASIDLMATSHFESFGNLAVTPTIGKTSGFLGVNYAYINDFDDDNGDGFGDNINLDRISLFSKWNIFRPSGKKFTLSGKYYYEDRRNGVEEFLSNRNYRELRGNDEVYGESIYTNRFELFGSYVFNTSYNLKLDYSISAHEQDSFYGSDFYKASQNIFFSNLMWNQLLGRHGITAGLTSRYQMYDDNTIATSSGADYQFIPGIFVQDEWEFNEKITALVGTRLDHFEEHGLIFAPRFSLKYNPSPWTSVRSNFGTGFRIVNLFTEDHAFVTGQREVVIEEALEPEESYNGSLNVNHLYTLGEAQGMLDIDVFYTYFTNKITPDYESDGEIRYANTRGFAVSKGIGMNLQHEFLFPLSFNLGFNYQVVTETENGQKRDIEFAPSWTGVFTINYKIRPWSTSIGYSSTLTGPMALPEVFDLDDNGNLLTSSRPTQSSTFGVHNIQISKNLPKGLAMYGGLRNIFDFVQPWSPLTGANDPDSNLGFSNRFDTSYAYAPIQGREYYLGIKWDLQ